MFVFSYLVLAAIIDIIFYDIFSLKLTVSSLEQVIDGLESQYQITYLDTIKDIAQFVSGNAHRLVFCDCFGSPCVPVVQNHLVGPLHRLSLNTSLTSQSACISQSANICNAKEEKLSKVCNQS